MRDNGALESYWSRVDGQTIHARVSANASTASAPAIVMVHGIGVSSKYLWPTAQLLAANYRVYAPDLPGSGGSAKPAADHYSPAYCANVIPELYAAHPRLRIVFCGNRKSANLWTAGFFAAVQRTKSATAK
jgi:pimeloyl-ACP methyl ester carboxylesterase